MGRLNFTFALIICLLSVFEAQGDISPDNKKIYHDITAGRGLYSQFSQVVSLNTTNFKNEIFNSSHNNAWIIEFYNSWCGHCHRFSPIWKQFALDIHGMYCNIYKV